MPYQDPEKRREAFKKYYQQNKEKVLEKNKKWRGENPDKVAVINKRYYEKTIGIPEAEPIDSIEHEAIDEALDTLIDIPKLHPEPLPKQKVDEAKVDQMLNDLKEGLK